MMAFDWPPGFERTSVTQRERNNNFQIELTRALDQTWDDLERIGVDDYRFGFDASESQRDGPLVRKRGVSLETGDPVKSPKSPCEQSRFTPNSSGGTIGGL